MSDGPETVKRVEKFYEKYGANNSPGTQAVYNLEQQVARYQMALEAIAMLCDRGTSTLGELQTVAESALIPRPDKKVEICP